MLLLLVSLSLASQTRECGENDVLRLHRVGAAVCKQVLDPRDLKDFCHCLVTVQEVDAQSFDCIAHENETGYGIWQDCQALQKAFSEKQVGVQVDSMPVECGCYEGANLGESYLYGDDVTDKLEAFVVKSSVDCDATDSLCPMKKLMAQKRDACLSRPKIEGKHNPEFYCFLTEAKTATSLSELATTENILLLVGVILLALNLYYACWSKTGSNQRIFFFIGNH